MPNYKEHEAKSATVTGKWQNALIILRCNECNGYIYPPRFVWIDADGTYCWSCGSKRQDELKVKQ